jgi:hypothetical protein
MAFKKAIIIVILFLFLIVAIIFTIFYIGAKQAIAPGNELNINHQKASAGEIKTSETMVTEKINKIVEDAKQNPDASRDTIRQEIISTINAEIIRQEEDKTLEQKAADLKAQEERQKIIDEINNKIKQAR